MQMEPKITRVVGRQTINLHGKQKVVDEIIYADYGKAGTTISYITYVDEPIDIELINSVAAEFGYQLKLPSGVEVS